MPGALDSDFIVIGNVSDTYFTIDVADFLGQRRDISDIVSLKTFANSEFCPRFTTHDEEDISSIGVTLEGKTVIMVSVHRGNTATRNELAMRNMVLARAAKDNGAKEVILVEPDLFYSAQDRGPRKDHGNTGFEREMGDMHKFNGQPFTARLYATLLKASGVDVVVTIHNHSNSTQYEFKEAFGENNFVNLYPDEIFNYYIKNSGVVDPDKTILVAPDKGASKFVTKLAQYGESDFPVLIMDKIRTGERKVHLTVSPESPVPIQLVKGKDLVVLDDMVRTGGTIAACCKALKEYEPRKIIFMTTHFHGTDETRFNLATPVISEIITTSTLPSILNRDRQGRLRKKMAVLKISKWIASYLNQRLNIGRNINEPFYIEDMSDKNPRSKEFIDRQWHINGK
ncbi:phosphoribosyltransferase family protein [Flammeovirgaceae bacterium SG7u.111]|nr:phosphoribosyltransferase family protein [Flammeovirgaceae bacterium SG7u.132]WPO38049.1 phosphoribosyltransferase family protein [Flammeovirgaceae bacterium SG7u.111]